ncbi:MAG TPA: Crp/Fnr family transcriptional regulator [Candidatus Elarobacter sp.]|jgi:CRP-like cAMP-binding protein|nr:Crp/Fnr family transcriptional regulator [Candidatus Elarobacter sp.]
MPGDRERRPTSDAAYGRGRNRLLAALPAAERARLERYIERVPMQQHLVLARSGVPLDEVWFPETAVGSAVVSTPEGGFVEASLVGAEGMVGIEALHGERRAALTVIVQVPGTGGRMPAADFRREAVASRGSLFGLAMRFTAAFQTSVAQVAACNARHEAGARLARWLLMAHDRVPGDEIRLTQEFLATMLGARRATVTQAANELRERGAIDYHRGRIAITDRAALEEMTCGCYAIVRREMERAAPARR